MRLTTLLLGSIIGLLPITVMAGSGHDHGHSHVHAPVDQATAKIKATKIVTVLAKRNTLDISWASTTASSVEKKTFKGQSEWVAVFVNKNITDTNKQKLYVFMTLAGDYIAANYTGN
ncbi:hypothetical protein JYT31_01415 [Beggiatoa alba]|nr:hypothetical protein [Beggiatoa alba]